MVLRRSLVLYPKLVMAKLCSDVLQVASRVVGDLHGDAAKDPDVLVKIISSSVVESRFMELCWFVYFEVGRQVVATQVIALIEL